MLEIIIYTDGACSGNPGPGGWGALLVAKKNNKMVSEKELSGGCFETTNNRMELTAAIQALKSLTRDSKVTLVTDSKYLMDGITKWISVWKENNWKNTKNKDIKNIDLWQEILTITQSHQITWEWVKGHNFHQENERADYLARIGMKEFKD